MITIKFKKLHSKAKLPTKAYLGDACWDVYATESVNIPSKGYEEVYMGFAVEIPQGYCITYRARSSQGSKGIQVHNGTIDSGYRGYHSVYIYNHSPDPYFIKVGDKVCQMFIDKIRDVRFVEVKKLTESERGQKRCGSSGR